MSAPVIVPRSEFYPVKPNTPIRLTVTIGDGQSGATVVTLNGVVVDSGETIEDLPIGGPGEDLKKKTLECTTTVKDVNPATNHTSVTYTLRGGVEDKDFSYDVTVSEAGRAIYDITFFLV